MKNELEKAMFIGLFLSKFDKQALEILGFSSWTEAFNIIGLVIGVKPYSIRNYRDEFDPVFPNKRKGWYKREIYSSRVDMLNSYKNLSFSSKLQS